MTDQVNTTAYKTIYTQHAGLIKDYLSALATDPNFYENEDLYSAGDNLFEAQKYWLYYLSGSDSAGKAGLIGYFDQRAETAEDLEHISTTQELAQLLYRYHPGDYMYDYSEAQGYQLIDTVLGETPGVTEGGHLAFIRKRMDPGLATQVDVTLSQAEVRIKDRIWLAEHHLYGSSRLGMRRYPSGAFYNSWDYTQTTPVVDTNLQVKQPWYSAEYNDVIQAGYGEPYGHTQTQTYKMQHTLGAKGYELTNHLGNVQVVVTDKKFEQDINDDDTVDAYAPSLTAAYDYYPFGMLMPGRYVRDTSWLGWRHKFNGMEADDELKGPGNSLDFGARMYSGQLGIFLSLDPLFKKFPWQSSYLFAANNPIMYVDKEGKEHTHFAVLITDKATTVIKKVTKGDFHTFHYSDGNEWSEIHNYSTTATYDARKGVRSEDRFTVSGPTSYGPRKWWSDVVVEKASNYVPELPQVMVFGSGNDYNDWLKNPNAEAGKKTYTIDMKELNEMFGIINTAFLSSPDFNSKRGIESFETAVEKSVELVNEKVTEKMEGGESIGHADLLTIEGKKTDSVICPGCNQKADSQHVDFVNGAGTFRSKKEK